MTDPTIIYGTAWKKERTTELVLSAWEQGFRAFDTACQPKHYREELVGAALAQIRASGTPRSGMYIQTKYTPVGGQDMATIPYDPTAPIAEQISTSLSRSLDNLQTEYLDAWILHSPMLPIEKTFEAWQVMERFVEEGKVNALGISNCYDESLFTQLDAQSSIKPSILQNRFYQQTGYDVGLRQFCLANKIRYQSFWTLTANPQVLEHPAIMWLVRKLRKTPAQILFRYLNLRGVTPLTGTSDQEHMKEDLEILEVNLSGEDLESIDQLLNTLCEKG